MDWLKYKCFFHIIAYFFIIPMLILVINVIENNIHSKFFFQINLEKNSSSVSIKFKIMLTIIFISLNANFYIIYNIHANTDK